MTISTLDQSQASGDVLATVAWARSTIALLAQESGSDRHAQLDEIDRRLRDPELHLVVVGEFSSGKSSLINTIVGAELFPRSVLPTTRAITQLRNSSTTTIEVALAGRPEPVTYSPSQNMEESDLFREIARLTKVNAGWGLSALMRTLTSDEAVAPFVQGIRVGLPFPALGRDLVLFDTPGTNDEEALTASVERLIAEEADAVAVVIRADIPVSASLQNLLANFATKVPPECFLFIVTHSDVVEPDQRDRALRSISMRLASAIGGEPPTLFDLSLRSVLRRNAGERLEEQDHEWVERFDRQLVALRDEIRLRREILGARQSLNLLGALISSLDADLCQELDDLQASDLALTAVAIDDVAAYSMVLRERYQRQVSIDERRFRQQLGRVADDHATALESTLISSIDTATSAKALQVATTTTAEQSITASTSALDHTVRVRAEEYAARLRAHSVASLAEFLRKYEDVVAVTHRSANTTTANMRMSVSTSLQVGDVGTTLRPLLEDVAAAKNSGMVVGAVIGTLLAPGIGTAIGGGIGRAVGSLFGPSMVQLKNSATESTKAQMASYRSGPLRQAVQTCASDVTRQLGTEFRGSLARLEREYGNVVADERTRQAQTRASIARRRAALLDCRQELKDHAKTVATTVQASSAPDLSS